MNEIFLLILGFLGVFAVICSFALLALGKIIDEFPLGDESSRTRGITSPIETTKISVVLFWALFIIGGWAVLQESHLVIIAGITILFAISLFLFTTVIVSFAVLKAMRERRKEIGIPGELPEPRHSHPLQAPAAVPPAEPASQAPVLRKRFNNPVTDFILNALLKKE